MEPDPTPRVPRNVVVLSWVSFFQDTASELLYPILPIFVTGVLGAPPVALGAIEGIAEATAATAKVGGGHLADRGRRRPLVATGYGISAVAKPLIGLATGWGLVLGARFLDRVGKGLRTAPRDAIIADETSAHERGRAFGLHRAADTAGAVVGPLLGLGLYHLLDERLRPLFLAAFLPAALSVGLVFFVRERPRPQAAVHHQGAPPGPLGRRYWTAMAVLAAFALVNFSDALILLRASELGLGVTGVVLAYVLYNVVYAALSLPAGILSDRVPRPFVMAGGFAVFALAYTGLGLASSDGWVWLLLPVYGAFTALTDGVGRAWVADLLPSTHRGRGLGYQQAVAGGGALVAGLWAGALWGEAGRLPLLVSGVAAAGLAVVLVLLAPRLTPRLAPEG